MYGRQTGILVAAIAPAELRAEGDVTAFAAQSVIDLQLGVDIFAVIVAQSLVLTTVDGLSLLVQRLQTFGAQRVGDKGEGVGIKRG